ncbi:MAG TPA: lamin tail domain-containing protein, partial [Polyangiaceae bacterium]
SCRPDADHLLISEIVTRPSGAEMIEIVNPTRIAVDLSSYWLSDSHLYFRVLSGGFSTASGSDFAARFPPGSNVGPGEYRTVALANASGGTLSFSAAYGTKPDFELRPTANGSTGDPSVPDMLSAETMPSIGATASLTDAGEPVVLFYAAADSPFVYDVDYVFFGTPSASNPAVDKSNEPGYLPDTEATSQRAAPAPDETGSLHRCDRSESSEVGRGGNGLTGHDETSEDASRSFVLTTSIALRTPGGPPPPGACVN